MNSNSNDRPRRSSGGGRGGGGRGGGRGGGEGGGRGGGEQQGSRRTKRKHKFVSSNSQPGASKPGAAATERSDKTTSEAGNGHSHPRLLAHGGSNGGGGGNSSRRGGPGILWTCETGLERKCRHQAADILQHYYAKAVGGGSSTDLSSSNGGGAEGASFSPARLTLEQELAMLKKEGSGSTGSNRNGDRNFPFTVYETKCKGTVLMLCTDPDAIWFPTSSAAAAAAATATGAASHESEKNSAHDEEPDGDDDDSKPPGSKRRCVGSSNEGLAVNESGGESEGKTASPPKPRWDPLDTVLEVIKDARDAMHLEMALASGGDAGLPPSALRPTSAGAIPSSRFVTRIIPLQVTCYASVDDIRVAFRSLLQRYLSTTTTSPLGRAESSASSSASSSSLATSTTTTTTYMVQSKRRHCDNLRSTDVIDCVGGLVPANWKVDLRRPDVVVWVEICTNLAGLSIVPAASLREAFQFNLLQARTASVASE